MIKILRKLRIALKQVNLLEPPLFPREESFPSQVIQVDQVAEACLSMRRQSA